MTHFFVKLHIVCNIKAVSFTYPLENFTLDWFFLHNQRLWWLWQIWSMPFPLFLSCIQWKCHRPPSSNCRTLLRYPGRLRPGQCGWNLHPDKKVSSWFCPPSIPYSSPLLFSPTMAVDEVCLDSCVYTKFGEDDEYCFKGANIPGTTECSV